MYEQNNRLAPDEFELTLCIKHGWVRVVAWRPLIVDLARQTLSEALRPIVFRRILKKHVRRVLAAVECYPNRLECQGLVGGLSSVLAFLSGRKLSWDSFRELGHSLTADSSSPDLLVSLGQLMGAGQEINAIQGHLKQAPACFCAMCWRFVLSGGKYCRDHRVPVGGFDEEHSSQVLRRSDNYWYGRKLSPGFAGHLRRLSSQAKSGRLRSGWKLAVETATIVPWLECFRPFTLQHLVSCIGTLDESGVLPSLIRTLDDHAREVGAQREIRSAFHRSLLNDRKAVFDLLLRAEARLAAVAERSSGWGGSRVGAGRPEKRLKRLVSG